MAPKVSGDAFKDVTCHILYIFSFSRHKHGGVWPGFAEVSRLPPPPGLPSQNPQLFNYRPEMLLLLLKPIRENYRLRFYLVFYCFIG